MNCVRCGAEYPDVSTECPACHVSLADGAPRPKRPFDPALDLIVVLETNNRIELALATGLLENAGIDYFVLGQIATLVQDIDPFLYKLVRVQVPRDREAEARELLEPLGEAETNPPPVEET